MTTSALTRHENDAIELGETEKKLKAEQANLTLQRAELSERAILDRDEPSRKQLEVVSKRLNDITHNLEILTEARSRLDSRMAEARHQIAQDERTTTIAAILSLTAKRATILATIEEQTELLSKSVAEAWALNSDALFLAHGLPDSAVVRGTFSQRRFTTSLEKLLGRHLHRFNVAQAIRPSNYEEWDWQRATACPIDFEATLCSLPLK